MHVDELDIPPASISEQGRRVIERAFDQARRHRHPWLTTEHVFCAVSQADWELFAEVVRDAGLNPHDVSRALDDHLRGLPASETVDIRTSEPARAACRLALQHAKLAGRTGIEPADLLHALLAEKESVPVAILRQRGCDVPSMLARLDVRLRERELRDEQLLKRFELPPYLRQFATNLNLLACQDKVRAVFGREAELQQVLEILSHRERANSVMLVGEPGVGKTAIVEGLARRVELEPETLPVRLREVQVVSLPMNGMVAGTMLRGMFEDRLQNVIRELRQHPHLVVFVDEAHTLVGAGSALGAPADAAQILKSSLSRGEIRMIAATTLSEYKQHIEEDEALARRFRCVHVAEPTIGETRRILMSARPRLERNYDVHLDDDVIDAALALAPRYMRHLRLPDKVLGWLDTAAVRTEMDGRRDVERHDVVHVVADAARIPEDLVERDVSERFADIGRRLGQRVVGQASAIRAVARRLVLNKGPLKDGFDRPDGVLLFLGPTGVGKTELAKAVAAFLFGDERKMIRIDMSEYQDGAGVQKLIGSPRGIAGSERGGVLTNQLRDNPYTVLLLDEIEKAAPALLNVFLQAFDEGWLTDGRGRRVYLSDAIVIMTSNIGSEHFRKLTSPMGFASGPAAGRQVSGDVTRELERWLSPEFRNRIDEVVVFDPLTRDEVREIARHYLAGIGETMRAAGKMLVVDADALERLVEEGHSLAYGARFLKRVIDERVKLPVSACWSAGSVFHVRVGAGSVTVDADPDGCAAA